MSIFTGTVNSDYIYYGYVSSGVSIVSNGYYYPYFLADIIYGNGGSDYLRGEGGDDQIYTGSGDDTAYGGDGNDLIDDYTASSFGGEDLMYGDAGNDSLYGYDGYDTLYGGTGNDSLKGESGYDYLYGEAGNDVLEGGSEGDLLDGGTGADSMYGGTGSDTYYVDDSGDYVEDVADSSWGYDTVYAGVSYALGANIENLYLTGRSALSGTGNELANYIEGNEGANVLSGLGGDDNIYGGSGADSLYGGDGNDYLDGGAGADYLDGGAGNDTYRVDSTSDVISETLTGTTGGVDTVSLGFNTSWTLATNVENLELYSGVVNGTGNASNNEITGTYSANGLYGLAGNDSLYGYDGNDTLDGGAGVDSMVGGEGNDTYYVDNTADLISDFAYYWDDYDYYEYIDNAGTDTVYASATYALSPYLENLTLTGTAKIDGTGNDLANTITGNTGDNYLTGNEGNDTLIGGVGNDQLFGGVGADSMVGGTGDDTYYADNAGDIIVEAAGAGTDRVYAKATHTLAANVENLFMYETGSIDGTGNALANRITGTTGNNYERGLAGNDNLDAGQGNDTLDGGTGVDTMTGGAGNDTYYVDAAGDVVSETASGTAGGTDSLYSTVSWTLGANFERLYLNGTTAANGTGNALDNLLQGNAYANTLRGLAGVDTIRSGTGVDVLIGGTGNDIFRFSVASESTPTSRDIIRAGDGAIAFEKAGAALGDRIDLSALDANTSASGIQHFTFGTAQTVGRLWVTTSGTSTILNGNTDSDSAIEFQLAIEDGAVAASAYTAADFILA